MVVHLSVVKRAPFGGPGSTITRSLCGRLNAACNDGMNLGDAHEVTCKFCLKIMAIRAKKAASGA